MNYVRKAVTTLGGIFLAALLLAALAPKAARGVVATLVQVANTPGNPVNMLAADATTAFVVTNTCTFSIPATLNYCIVDPLYTVPAGQIAVIDSFTGLCQVDPGPGKETVEFRLEYIGPAGTFVEADIAPNPVFQLPGVSSQVSVGSENFRTYASAGGFSVTAITGSPELSSTDFCRFTLSGHLVTP